MYEKNVVEVIDAYFIRYGYGAVWFCAVEMIVVSGTRRSSSCSMED